MRILIVTDSMNIGGAETHVFTLIKELRKKELKITLLSSGGAYAKILQKSGIRFVFAPLNKRDPFSVRRCIKILREEMHRADVVHAHTRFTSFLANRIRGNSRYPKIVTTAHLNFPIFPFGAFAFWGDGTLAVSEDIRDYLETNYNIKKEDVILTKNYVDLSTHKKAGLDKKLIIHTSRIDRGRAKASFLLVSSAEEILKVHRGWRIMIVGDGNLFSKLKKEVQSVNLRLGFEGVILTGARSDIPSLLEYGSIFVGVSRSALEGMASGLPTIICGDEGYGGIVYNDNFDLLSYTNFCARGLKDSNVDALTKDLVVLIKNANLRKELGAFSRDSIKKHYPASVMADDAIRCYESVFSPPSVCLMGYFGYKNLGDEETLKCAVQALSEMGIKDISVLSAPHSSSLNTDSPKVKFYDRTLIGEINVAINHCDVFILCGGNLMQNETSQRSLIYYEQITAMAKRRGKRVYILSSGFGKINGRIGEFFLKKGLSASDFCGCRTEADLMRANKYTTNSKIMPDFCFLLPQAEKRSAPKRQFLWIISGKKNISVEDIIDISRRRGVTPIAVSLFADNDIDSISKIQRYGIKTVIPKNQNQLKKLLANSEFSLSERLHGAIFSIVSHVPTYITTDSDKNQALLNEIDSRTVGCRILLPYSKNHVLEKKEIGANDSDFNYVINSLKQDIKHALHEIF